ncbi:T9SS type A sorting domain-containing protein [Polaribacter ponticola]|uniref:T9SS type A sorting domain-containing protein n=1 Tax=Polaribacter ponticola TaxID=2978475 RepID=A0ABT5S563_9FLAO|nr:T9SS type A sorting domain-containing protein [Polaribacter sp. MSW5]MDD7913241.1 T9SS type A sorting domain-containing protein [Polaribacter sp. MSW5]
MFLPTDFFWSWSGEILGEVLYEFKKSGVHGLENGNLLICVTSKGRLSEVDSNGDVVWVYRNPVGTKTYNQFVTEIEILRDNSMFRGEKYHKNYEGFLGKDLSPKGIIEDVNTLSNSCNETLSFMELNYLDKIITFNNPVLNKTISFYEKIENVDILVYNMLGQVILKQTNFKGDKIVIPNLVKGIHFIMIKENGKLQVKKFLVK